MRITAAAKLETRRRILEAAQSLFRQFGFESATTREIATRAGIGVGTLFNYFPSKEDIAMALVAEALAEARRQHGVGPPSESLEEDLFALISAEIRALRPHRGYVRPVLETALSPMARATAERHGEAIGVEHLELMELLIAARRPGDHLSTVALSLYWALYTGVLAFWACDASPNQEETLAVLDHYLKAFVTSLSQSQTSSRDGAVGEQRRANS
jgi:AcrR family transcriptional regulator